VVKKADVLKTAAQSWMGTITHYALLLRPICMFLSRVGVDCAVQQILKICLLRMSIYNTTNAHDFHYADNTRCSKNIVHLKWYIWFTACACSRHV